MTEGARKRSAWLHEGRVRAAQAGRFSSGVVPFGYTRGPRYNVYVEGGRKRDSRVGLLEVDPDAAQIVKRIFALYCLHRSLVRVERLLNQTTVRSPGGRRWTRATLRCILRNPVYKGDVRFAGMQVRGVQEPIVTREDWERVARYLTENRRGKAKRGP